MPIQFKIDRVYVIFGCVSNIELILILLTNWKKLVKY